MIKTSYIIVVLFLTSTAFQKGCTFSQDCSINDHPNDCWPKPTDSSNNQPKKPTNPKMETLCPDLYDQDVCCTDFAIYDQDKKFILLDEALGAAGTGCSICAANLKRFYCHFSCDPNQDSWAKNYTVVDHDDRYKSMHHSLGKVDAHVDYKLLCNIFESCQDINFVSALGASASAQGFFNLQASQGVAQGNLIINWIYEYEPKPPIQPYTVPVNGCSSDFSATCTDEEKTKECKDPQGYALNQSGTCACLNCQKACKATNYSTYLQERTMTTGILWKKVFITLGIVVVQVILSSLYTYFKRKIAKPRRKESMDSMYNVRRYVDAKFPVDEDDDNVSECLSEFNEDQLGMDKVMRG